MDLAELQKSVVGLDEQVTLLDGTRTRYINFDNASSTPSLLPVQEKINEFSKWYSNIHRGTGFKSQLSSWVFEEARNIIAQFVGADASSAVIFCKNTTEAINKLALRFQCPMLTAMGKNAERPIIFTSIMEHHSNELPWRKVGNVVHIDINADGTVKSSDLYAKLKEYKGKVCLVAISGASNVTGYINPIHEYAARVHEAGAQIAVDAAQLVPHRSIDIRPKDDPQHIDYLAFSAHKMYAPYGIGVLVTNRTVFEHGDPDYVGGGTVDIVDLESAYWKDLPEREEAGTPDIVGVVALAKAVKILEEVDYKNIAKHEADLTSYALVKLSTIPQVVIYGDKKPENAASRLGVISFNVEGMDHALVAAILAYEGGIGVRNGCFCAHPYVKRLLGVSPEEAKEVEKYILARDRSKIPGAVRMSFGLYNTKAEIDKFLEVLNMIVESNYQGKYQLDKERGEYYPEGFTTDFSKFFTL
jgi:selenocysteine lyase/cysteine desulfurase